jgi:hypothetical protein
MTVQGWPCWSLALLGARLWPVTDQGARTCMRLEMRLRTWSVRRWSPLSVAPPWTAHRRRPALGSVPVLPADQKLDRAKFVSVRGRPLRRSGRWCVHLRTGVDEIELQLGVIRYALRRRAVPCVRSSEGGLAVAFLPWRRQLLDNSTVVAARL